MNYSLGIIAKITLNYIDLILHYSHLILNTKTASLGHIIFI